MGDPIRPFRPQRSRGSVNPRPTSPRDRLLAAAKARFAAEGFERTTTAAIARMAGTSESQLVKHFSSKEGLLQAIFEEAWRHLEEPAQRLRKIRQPALWKLLSLVDLALRALEVDPPLCQLMMLEGRRMRKRDNQLLITEGFRKLVAFIDHLLAEMRTEGQLRPDLHLQAIRSALFGALEALVRDRALAAAMSYPADYGPADIRAAFHTTLRAFIPEESESGAAELAS